jgi:hypothetical protein
LQINLRQPYIINNKIIITGGHMKILKRYSKISAYRDIHSTRRYRNVYAAEDTNDSEDVEVSPNVEDAFDDLVAELRDTSFEDLGEALDDIVNDPKLYALLSEGFGDGRLADVKMSSSPEAIPVSKLLPCQSEIGLDNSLSYPLKQDCSNLFGGTVQIVAPIVTYQEMFVIDGHHRWSQLYMMNPKAKISAINFNYSNDSPWVALRNFQGAIAVANKDVPKSYNKVNNVYDMSKDEIIDYIDSNIQDVCWESLVKVGVCEDRDSAIDYITGNVMKLKRENYPFPGAPDREYMPQTDKKALTIAEEGQTNI